MQSEQQVLKSGALMERYSETRRYDSGGIIQWVCNLQFTIYNQSEQVLKSSALMERYSETRRYDSRGIIQWVCNLQSN